MYLKSIEVQGFKSFANKIVFEFHNGITGIVGPNGSGKSNVADAVRWVLGEQSAKQLRGAKMEDIIFSGTENRKPQGFAYVALTIENSDHQLPVEYEEVTIARRVYRSGESEYLLNGHNCRLKDVNELFYDTGIGKEGYSIIGQGQIDRILSGKPEERRELFDEAAGIVKFKRRKNEAIKKLDAERQNLVRIRDILSELEKQVGPLEKQAQAAKEYLHLKEELKLYDINLFLTENQKLKDQLENLQAKIAIVQCDFQSSKQAYEKSKTDYEKVEKELEELSQRTEVIQNQAAQEKLTKEKREGEINLLKEQIRSAQTQNENFSQRIEILSQERKGKETEWKNCETENNTLQKQLKEAEQKNKDAFMQTKEVTDKITKALEQVEHNRAEIIRLLNEKSTIKENMQRYHTMSEQIQIRKAELSRKLLQYKTNEELQKQNIIQLQEGLQEVQREIKEKEEKQKELTEQIHKIHEWDIELEKEQTILQQTYHTEKSKLDALTNMTERYDGYGNSIRKVMEWKTKKEGIIGVVADIIKAEKKYETAIETALGGSIQNIVTDNEITAKELIEYLKKNKFGRATFLPLDGISNRNPLENRQVLEEKGVLGIASDLVQVEKKYETIAVHLLGRIIVADHIDHALQIAKKYHHTLRIVTLEGELLNAGGSMTGGAFKNAGNLLGRRREMEELKEKTNSVWKKWEEVKKQIDQNKKENIENRKELEEQKVELQEKYLLQNTANLSLSHAKEENTQLMQEYNSYVRENRELEGQVTDIKEEIEKYTVELEKSEDRHRELEEKIELLLKQAEEDKKREQKQNEKTDGLRLIYANLKQRLDFLSENKKRIEKEIEKLKKEEKEIEENKIKFEQESEQKQVQIKEIQESILKSHQRNEELEKELCVFQQEKERLTQSQKKNFIKREELSERIAALDKENFRLNSQKENCEEALDAKIHYMWEEYELTYSEIKEAKQAEKYQLEEIEDNISMKKKVTGLKNKIKNLGTVNVNAIEDFKEISERYQFLKGQHDDLITAEKTLMQIIEELDAGMRTQFEEKFKEIKAEFDKVFKELFGGGKGTLELVEEEDILEAGIRIISQPPGKKLQNMMQLSGGEKALTAISLLFAIQNLKPSPFCLLDEIEAALDDSNVGRFAQYLHKLTEHTQFIVITHRRGTMSAADRLYGITMQEKGVSTLVSVNLIEAELERDSKKSL